MRLRVIFNVRAGYLFRFKGFCLYPFLLIRGAKGEDTVRTFRHELEHAYQIREMGLIRYIGSYYWENIRKGYQDNRYEIRCREAAGTPLTAAEQALWDTGIEVKDHV